MLEVIDRLVNWLLSAGLIIAACALLGREPYLYLRDLLTSRKRMHFMRREKRTNPLERLLRSVSGEKADVGRFTALSGAIAGLALIVLWAAAGRFSVGMVILALGFGLVPLLVRWAQLQSKRVRGSYEGMSLVTTLSNCYIITSKNMITALDLTVNSLKDCPYSKRIIAMLTKTLKQAKNEEDVKEALEMLTYSYRTEWASILSFCIFIAVVDSSDVSAALASLIEQFKRAKQVMEKAKRYNREAFLIMQLLVPAVYVGLMCYGAYMFNRSVFSVFMQQITDPTGIKMLVAMLGLGTVCWVLASIIRKPKYDL